MQARQAPSPTPEAEEKKEPVAEVVADAALESAPETKLVVEEKPVTKAVKFAEKPKPINMAPSPAKRGNPNYTQTCVYLTKETLSSTKIALLKSRDNRDVSELVEDLLNAWLTKQT